MVLEAVNGLRKADGRKVSQQGDQASEDVGRVETRGAEVGLLGPEEDRRRAPSSTAPLMTKCGCSSALSRLEPVDRKT